MPTPYTERGYKVNFTTSDKNNQIAYCIKNIIVVLDVQVFRNFLSKIILIQNFDHVIIFNKHIYQTTSCSFNQQGNLIASGDEKGNVFIWETQYSSKYKYKYEKLLTGKIFVIIFSPDGKRIFLGGEGKSFFGYILMFDTGNSAGEIKGISKSILCADFRPVQPFLLAIGSEDYNIIVFEGPPYKFQKFDKTHKNFVTDIKFSSDGLKCISVSADKSVFYFN